MRYDSEIFAVTCAHPTCDDRILVVVRSKKLIISTTDNEVTVRPRKHQIFPYSNDSQAKLKTKYDPYLIA